MSLTYIKGWGGGASSPQTPYGATQQESGAGDARVCACVRGATGRLNRLLARKGDDKTVRLRHGHQRQLQGLRGH